MTTQVKNSKGNYAQSKSRGQKVYYVPVEVFRDKNERKNSNFPSENCRYVSYGAGMRVLVGYVITTDDPGAEVIRQCWNWINKQINEWNRNNRCMIGDCKGHLVRCSDYSKKCSECPFCRYRQLRVINYSEPEEPNGFDATGMDDFEMEMDLNNILKAINKRSPQAGKVFDLYNRYGYSVAEISEIEGIPERRVRYLLEQAKEIGMNVMYR
jgi:hypothetical protein